MRTESRRSIALSAAVALVLAFISCAESPTGPSLSTGAGSFVSLRLVAPQELAPGESVQLAANAYKSDGSVENVTGQAQWTVLPAGSEVLAVTGTGLASGGESGRGFVAVRFANLIADATIFVLPKGTFRLAGSVVWCGVGFQNVTVTVISGVGAGITARTDLAGNYELYGVAGPVEIRASKDGYPDRIVQVDVTAHSTLTFPLMDNPSGAGCWDY